MKDELGGKIMKKFVGLRAKAYSYLTETVIKVKEKCVIKIRLKFNDYRICFEATQLENKINYLEKNKIDERSLIKITKNL